MLRYGFLVAILVVAGCESSGDKENISEILGTWAQPCLNSSAADGGPESSVLVELVVNATSYKVTNKIYDGVTDCSGTTSSTIEELGTLNISGNNVDVVSGVEDGVFRAIKDETLYTVFSVEAGSLKIVVSRGLSQNSRGTTSQNRLAFADVDNSLIYSIAFTN